VQQPVDSARGDHQAGVYCTAHNPAQRVPGPLVEPVEEVVPTILHHVGGGPVVEPRIELMDYRLEADDGEEARGKSGQPGN